MQFDGKYKEMPMSLRMVPILQQTVFFFCYTRKNLLPIDSIPTLIDSRFFKETNCSYVPMLLLYSTHRHTYTNKKVNKNK